MIPSQTAPTCPAGQSLNPITGQCYSTNERNAGTCPCVNNPTVGNPINPGSGNKYEEATDYKGSGAFPLTLTRSYNSLIANESFSPGHADNTLGVGWTSNLGGSHLGISYAPVLYSTCQEPNPPNNWYACPLTGQLQPEITVWHASGGQDVFKGQPLVPEPGSVGQLTYDGVSYYYLRTDGYTEVYNASGQLTAVKDPHGLEQTYSYAYTSVFGTEYLQSLTVTDVSTGRQMVLNYDTTSGHATFGLITSVTVPSTGNAPPITYGYDASGNLQTVTYPDGSIVTYEYNDSALPHALTGLKDEKGNEYAAWSYNDTTGQAICSEHAPSGNAPSTATTCSNDSGGIAKVTIAYNSDGSADVTEATGLVRHLTFTNINGVDELVTASAPCMDCGNKSAAITYDSNGDGYVAAVTDFNGNVTLYSHDTAGRETSRVEASGAQEERTIDTTWNSALGMPEDIKTYSGSDATGTLLKDVSYCYNYTVSGGTCNDSTAAGLVWTVTTTDKVNTTVPSRTTTYTYNSQGLLLSVDGPRTDVSDVTSFAYYTSSSSGNYNAGDLHTVTDALGHVTTVSTYTASGFPTAVVDPNNVTTTFSYDARQRLLSKTVGGASTSYKYYLTGDLQIMTLPDTSAGSTYTYVYDIAHRATSVTDGLGETIVYTLDTLGHRTEEDTCANATNCGPGLSGDLKVHTRAYDNQGRLKSDTGGMGQLTQYGYDANGNVTQVTDPNSNITHQYYDPLNRLYQVQDPSGTTTYNIDFLDHIEDVTDPRGFDTHYAVDAFGDVLQLTSPDTGTTTYTYDAAGNRLTRIDARNIQATYTYDALNRLKKISYPDSTQNVTYTYDGGYVDGIGRLTKISDPSGVTNYTNFDAWGDLLQKSFTIGGQSFTTAYTYDAPGHMSETELQPPGQANPTAFITYKHDALGRQSEIDATWSDGGIWVTTPIVKGVTYEPFGDVSGLQYHNGLNETRTYDLDYRLSTISITAIQGLGFGYDSDNNLETVTDSVNMGGLSYAGSYGYDAMNRLTSAPNESYIYDADGNRTQSIINGTTTTYTPDTNSNRLLSLSGATNLTFKYAADGSMSDDGSYTYNYDDSGRLINLVSDATKTTTDSYVYNGLGQRAEKSGGTYLNYYLYDEAGHLQAEYGATGSINAVHVWLNDRPVAYYKEAGTWNLDPSVARYVHTDQLDTPRVTTNSSGGVVSKWYSDPFGVTTSAIGGPAYNLRFPGQYNDAEDGYNYNMDRDYDPGTGRYIESDPIGLAGGSYSTYAYAGGNPISLIDPYGLWDWPSLPQSVVDYSAGLGDTLSFELTNQIRNAMGTNDVVNKCSTAFTAGQVSAIVVDIGLGGAVGLEAAEANAGRSGYEFSHWIPSRFGGPHSPWNGNYVSQEFHYLTDPYRFPLGWQQYGGKLPAALQQLLRIPWVYPGAAAGGAVGAVSAASQSCGCQK